MMPRPAHSWPRGGAGVPALPTAALRYASAQADGNPIRRRNHRSEGRELFSTGSIDDA